MVLGEAYVASFAFLARGKVLRGSLLDPFGWMRERRMERTLRDRYFTLVDEIVARLDPSNLEAAVTMASYPDEIRGFGKVKDDRASSGGPRREGCVRSPTVSREDV